MTQPRSPNRSPAKMDPVLARQLKRPMQGSAQRNPSNRKPIKKRAHKSWGNPAHKPSFWQNLSEHPLLRIFSFGQKAPYHLQVTPPDPWGGNIAQGRNILQSKFYFYGQRSSGAPLIWKPERASPDWLTAMHGFEWLRDLKAVGGDQARRNARMLVKDWIVQFKRWDPVAWRPDITGARIATWIGLHDFFLASADDGYRLDVFDSIQKQSRYLTRVLPGHMKGSRLITALKGQIYACLALPNSQTRLFQALALLQEEINKQVLPDGGHIERNPMTHAQVLQNFLDIRGALRCGGLAVPEALQNAIRVMAPVLRFYMHGDNKLAQFNGGSEGDDHLLDTILQQAHPNGKPATHAQSTGYERFQLGRSVVLFDVGTPPLPGYDLQIHAAPLSFEFSIARERMIVNCGHAGTTCAQLPMTMALRNTAAHSTATIANTNSLELRSEGGIGRHPKTIHLHQENTKDQILVAASHDGYQSNLGVMHHRQIYLGDGGEELRGQDSFTGNAGHPFHIRFHLAPDVKASLTGDNNGVLLRMRSGAGWRFRCQNLSEANIEITLEESIYVPQCGDAPKRTTQIVLTGFTPDKETPVKWNFRREKKLRTHAEEKLMLDLPHPPEKITELT